MPRSRKFFYKGFTLIEVVIAFVVIGMLVGALAFLFNSSITDWDRSRQSADQNQAARMTFERLVRDIEEAKGGIGSATNTGITLYDSSCNTTVYSYAEGVLSRNNEVLLSKITRFGFKYYNSSRAELTGVIDPSKVSLITVWFVLPGIDLATTLKAPPATAGAATGPFRALLLAGPIGEAINYAGQRFSLWGPCGVTGSPGEFLEIFHADFYNNDHTFWAWSFGDAGKTFLYHFDQDGKIIFKKEITDLHFLSVNQTNGAVWLATAFSEDPLSSRSVKKYNSSGTELFSLVLRDAFSVPYLLIDIGVAPDGSCFVGTNNGPVHKINANSPTVDAMTSQVFSDTHIGFVPQAAAPGGYEIWVGTGEKVYRYRATDLQQIGSEITISGASITDVAVDTANSSYWVFSKKSGDKLFKLDSAGNIIQNITLDTDAQSFTDCHVMAVDPNNQDVWIADTAHDRYVVFDKNGIRKPDVSAANMKGPNSVALGKI